jgi:hypothetical protein
VIEAFAIGGEKEFGWFVDMSGGELRELPFVHTTFFGL